MSNGFLIKRISIENFRGYSQQDFNFFNENDNKFGLILLGGPNGYGKTSLLDAIEWCLTGTVTRLREDYEVRNEKKNTKIKKCLIRHNGLNNEVCVEIEGIYENKPILLKRVFNKTDESEAFNPENSIFFVNNNQINNHKTMDYIFRQPIAKDFYERFTCSYEKNIRVYEKSRTNIYEMFSSFFGGTKEIETIINNLDGINKGKKDRKLGIIEKLDKSISENTKLSYLKSKENYETAVENLNSLLEEKQRNDDISPIFKNYPNQSSYEGEVDPWTILRSEDSFQIKINKLKIQKNKINKLKYLKNKYSVYREILTYKKDIENVLYYNDFIEYIWDPYNSLEEELLNIQGKNLESIKNEKKLYDSLKINLNKLSLPTKEGAVKLKELSANLVIDNEQIITFNKIDSLFALMDSFSNQLEGFKTPDEELNALRTLVDNTRGFKKHREAGHDICPLCGSAERFPQKDMEIAKIATDILGAIDQKRANLQQEYNECDSNIKDIYKKFFDYLTKKIDDKIDVLKKLISDFETTNEFRSSCVKFSLSIDEVDREQLEQKKNSLKQNKKNQSSLLALEAIILGNISNKDEEIQGIYNIYNKTDWITKKEFSESDLSTKIQSLNQYINFYNKKHEAVSTEIKIENLQSDTLDTKSSILEKIINELQNDYSIEATTKNVNKLKIIYVDNEKIYNKQIEKLDKLKHMSIELKKVRKQWDKDMVEEIKAPLQKIYRRINRHTNIKDINLLIEGKTNTMASLMAKINDEEVSATNILSAGQLSVVALAIFITVAMGQKQSPFKCYFMDDAIQTMDDLNILSFIDLLRTELSISENQENRFADQLFFTTCDENLERLMTHKMKSFGVNYTHLHFTGYGDYMIKA
ncbi:hypothetical protein ACQKJG_23230 [Priestia megaterium]|uniref:hypothetical protein n=1 Tax=Priestia TaxID=2800373 RepID=UPI001C8DD141|nr:hypothetical protein [Priestia aryabhattai]MBY0029886.1 AAA family ATPase [Priestia aryabhattai]